MKSRFFIEKMPYEGTNSFNIWEKEGANFYNIATFFDSDSSCGLQFTISVKEKSVCYPDNEIKDELESELIPISDEVFQIIERLGINI